MQTKQKAQLTYITPLWSIANAIRYSRYNHDKSDTAKIIILHQKINHIKELEDKITCPKCSEHLIFDSFEREFYCTNCKESYSIEYHIGKKDFELIKKVGFKMKHESVLEFCNLIFDVKLSQKALLELSRHRIGISLTVSSSRYMLKKLKDIEFEPTNDEEINKDLEVIKSIVKKHLQANKSLDDVSKLLPQAFIYHMQLEFNIRSFLHFLKLRLHKDAHRDIRIIAKLMFDSLPELYKELILTDEEVKKLIENF